MPDRAARSGAVLPWLIGFLTMAAAIAMVPMVVVPSPERSEFFVDRILWAEILNALAWGIPGGLLGAALGRRGQSVGGIAPTGGGLVLLYCTSSLSLMLARAWLPDVEFLERWHLGVQILLAVGLVFGNVVLLVAARHAQVPAPELPAGCNPPDALVALLQSSENLLDQAGDRQGRDEVKGIRERLRYSVFVARRSMDNEAYRSLDSQVVDFANWVIDLDPGRIADASGERAARLRSIRQKAEILANLTR